MWIFYCDKKIKARALRGFILKVIMFLLLVGLTGQAYSYVDLNLSYTYSVRRIDGVETPSNPEPGGAQTTTTGYSINWAWFMWEYTALELNWSATTQRLVDDRAITVTDSATSTSYTIEEQDSTVVTEVSGVGIRQAFASRKATIVPSLAIGYAQYTTSGLTKFRINVNGTRFVSENAQEKEVFSSSYASFSLRFRMTQLMSLTLAAKTIMPEFDTSQADNNVTYSAGFSWIF